MTHKYISIKSTKAIPKLTSDLADIQKLLVIATQYVHSNDHDLKKYYAEKISFGIQKHVPGNQGKFMKSFIWSM